MSYAAAGFSVSSPVFATSSPVPWQAWHGFPEASPAVPRHSAQGLGVDRGGKVIGKEPELILHLENSSRRSQHFTGFSCTSVAMTSRVKPISCRGPRQLWHVISAESLPISFIVAAPIGA